MLCHTPPCRCLCPSSPHVWLLCTLQGPTINFNVGLRTCSVLGLAYDDYVRVEQPTECAFGS